MIRRALIAWLFPTRLRITSWHDRRTAELRTRYARVLCGLRRSRRQSNAPDLHVHIERDAVPAWLELPENVTVLRRQAS